MNNISASAASARDSARRDNGEFGTQEHAEAGSADLTVPVADRITFSWEDDGSGSRVGSSTDGWGSRALIVPPEAGDGQTYYWEVRNVGWSWDGRSDSLEEAEDDARAAVNRMLAEQEADPGMDWDAEEEPAFWEGAGEARDVWR